jgi:hypothetical protein
LTGIGTSSPSSESSSESASYEFELYITDDSAVLIIILVIENIDSKTDVVKLALSIECMMSVLTGDNLVFTFLETWRYGLAGIVGIIAREEIIIVLQYIFWLSYS